MQKKQQPTKSKLESILMADRDFMDCALENFKEYFMSTEKQYANRDPEAQGMHYITHVGAMTSEGLHSKSSIAAELAHRDIEIARLHAEIETLRTGYDAARLEIGSLKKAMAQEDDRIDPDHEALLAAAQAYIVASNRMDAAMQDGFNVQGAMSGIIGATDNLHAAIAANKKG